jgi:hypothetical protein
MDVLEWKTGRPADRRRKKAGILAGVPAAMKNAVEARVTR